MTKNQRGRPQRISEQKTSTMPMKILTRCKLPSKRMQNYKKKVTFVQILVFKLKIGYDMTK